MASINESSRSAATEADEGTDQIGLDTPRSGVATPQPDLQDRRLPGIMSYFGQVRPSLHRLWSAPSGPFTSTARSAAAAPPIASQQEEPHHQSVSPSPMSVSPVEPVSRSPSEDQGPPLLHHEKVALPSGQPVPVKGELHPYPTPPASQRSSLRGVNTSDSGGESILRRAASTAAPPKFHKKSISGRLGLKGRRSSLLAPVTAVVVTQSNVHARYFSNPGSRRPSTTPNSPTRAQSICEEEGAACKDSASVHQLKKLTNVADFKSGQNTPKRSPSTVQPSQSDGSDERRTSDGSSEVAAGTETPPTAVSAVPAAKGKLTIKISEARGLKKCRAPYVVAVFQRSELISGSPRLPEEDDETAISNVAMGGVPIQRQGSDSGRIPMAIPMRSRQSSNTSVTEFNTFRNKTTPRRSFTNPKWDAEAVL